MPELSKNGERFAPTCTVVICTRDRPQQLMGCLQALQGLVYPRFDVLVVDNAPNNPQAREVARRRGARYIVEPVIGVSHARNRGARACETEIVAYLDDDAIPEPGWLSGLASEFKDPAVMAVSGRILPTRVETEAECWCQLVGGFDLGEERWAVDRQNPDWFALVNFSGMGNEANMALRRRAFDLWPGFNERLGRGTIMQAAEGSHALFSLVARGYRAIYSPQAVVRHPFPRSMDELRTRHLRELAAATAYFTMLVTEEPGHRRATLQYVVEALRGTRRPWRKLAPGLRPRIVPRWRKLIAYLSGPLLYARSRLARPPGLRRP